MATRRIVVCDVNETLLDVGALAPQFAAAFGDEGVLKEWFSTVLLYSEVATLAGPYSDFGRIAGAALDMLASARGTALGEDARAGILHTMRTLPAHPDVADGLTLLRDAGLRVVTLTNSSPAMVEQQLASAGIAAFFERAFSVHEVRRFKPAPEPYQHVAAALGVPIGQLRMVAAHSWDIVGALRAGCAGTFVARPGKVMYPLGPQPDIVAPDFRSAAGRIVAAETA
jgi:2-haloacid dehalogenase